MKKVFQTTYGKPHGNCMQAAVASLLNKELKDVPNFIEYGDEWLSEIEIFLKKNGYEFSDEAPYLYNYNDYDLRNPTDLCFEEGLFDGTRSISEIIKYKGVDGYFIASVYSPSLFDFKDWSQHVVIIDKDCNIIHDPNINYEKIINYPFSSLINYNGITDIWNIKKIKENECNKIERERMIKNHIS